MAPEQVDGKVGPIRPPTDVYALGAMLYELLTGQRPVSGESLYERVLSTLHDVPTSPRELDPKRVPKDLIAVAMKALEKLPKDRIQSASEFAKELDRWLDGLPVRSREPSTPELIWSGARRYPKTSLFAAAFVLLLIAGGTISTTLYLLANKQKARADQNATKRAKIIGEMAGLAQGEGRKLRIDLVGFRQDVLKTAAAALDEVVQENDGIGSIELGNTLSQQAVVRLLIGKPAEALESSKRAYDVFASLPSSYQSRLGMGTSLHQTGRLLFATGRAEEGFDTTKRSAEILRGLLNERQAISKPVSALPAPRPISAISWRRPTRPRGSISTKSHSLNSRSSAGSRATIPFTSNGKHAP